MSKSKHVIESRFWLGDIVYRRVDSGNNPGLVIGLFIYPESPPSYRCAFDGCESTHYDMELDDQPCWVLKNDNEEEESEV